MIRASLFAPAKVNLDLVITGTRSDGYHTLRSHVAFADIGDDIVIACENSNTPSVTCTVSGPCADHLSDLDPQRNLAVRAAELFLNTHNLAQRVHIDLVKNLPSGAGLGSGSSDAAAVWRGLNEIFGKTEPTPLSLGADVPVCFHAHPCLMEGIGEILSPWETDPLPAILIWPGSGGSTAELYADFDAAKMTHQDQDGNAFQDIACKRCPAIGDALAALRALPGCRKAQLSGSGTAVFGLFDVAAVAPSLTFPWIRNCLIGAARKPLVTVQR